MIRKGGDWWRCERELMQKTPSSRANDCSIILINLLGRAGVFPRSIDPMKGINPPGWAQREYVKQRVEGKVCA